MPFFEKYKHGFPQLTKEAEVLKCLTLSEHKQPHKKFAKIQIKIRNYLIKTN